MKAESKVIQEALNFQLYEGVGYICGWVETTFAHLEKSQRTPIYSRMIHEFLRIYGVDIQRIGLPLRR